MTIETRLLAGCAWLLGTCALSCGHAHNSAPPAATTASEQPSATAQRPAATQQTRPPEALRAEIEKEQEAEPQSVLEAGADSPLTAADAPPPGADSIESFMLEHFVISAWARDSIVDGNLEVIRTPLLALADYSYKNVAPGGWMNGIAQMQAAARLTAQAQTLSAAANGIATMGRVCGQCHREQSGPEVEHYKSEKTTPKSDRLDGRMFRHAWAVERLWEGLTAPSDNAWQAGADALAHAPVAAPKTQPALTQTVVNALSSVRQLGVKARKADSAELRASVYGQLLFTCAECHRQQPALEF